MMTTLNKVLIGALIAQLGLIALLRGDDAASGIAPLTPVLGEFDVAAPTRVQIFGAVDLDKPDKKDEAIVDKPAIELTRRGDGWILSSHFNYPVEAAKVDELLGKLDALEARGAVARSTARQHQLDVAADDHQRKIVVFAGADTPAHTLYVGSPAGARLTAVRRDGAEDIFGVTNFSPFSVRTDAAAWIDPVFLQLDASAIESLRVDNAVGTIHLVRVRDPDGTTRWEHQEAGAPAIASAGQVLDIYKIEDLAADIAEIRMIEPADPARAVDKPLATIAIRIARPADPASGDPAAAAPVSATTTDDYVIELIADGDARYYVRQATAGSAVLTNKFGLQGFVDLTVSGLYKAPEPEAGPPDGQPDLPDIDFGAPGMPPGMPPGLMPAP